MIRYHRSPDPKRCRPWMGPRPSRPSPNLVGNHKRLGSGGSMVARLKLKGIDGRAHKEWSLRLNLTQHGKTHKGKRGV
jgi:hypothetical protein